MKFKFWRWRIEVKIRDLDGDKKIVFLAQELIKTVAKSGRKLQGTPEMASIEIDIHKNGNNGYVSNIINHWELPLGEITCIEWDRKEEALVTED